MSLSPEFKREIKRVFSKNESIANNIHNSLNLNSTIQEISDKTGISVTFLNNNIKDLKILSFSI